MQNILMIIFSIFAIALVLALLWYFIKSVGIMGKRSIWLAILAFLFSPLAQIVFYFSQKDSLTIVEIQTFKKFFWALLAYLVLGIGAAILIPAIAGK